MKQDHYLFILASLLVVSGAILTTKSYWPKEHAQKQRPQEILKFQSRTSHAVVFDKNRKQATKNNLAARHQQHLRKASFNSPQTAKAQLHKKSNLKPQRKMASLSQGIQFRAKTKTKSRVRERKQDRKAISYHLQSYRQKPLDLNEYEELQLDREIQEMEYHENQEAAFLKQVIGLNDQQIQNLEIRRKNFLRDLENAKNQNENPIQTQQHQDEITQNHIQWMKDFMGENNYLEYLEYSTR